MPAYVIMLVAHMLTPFDRSFMIAAHSSKRLLIKLVALGRGFGSSLDDDERESVQRVK